MSDSGLLLFSLLLLYAWCILLIWKLKSFYSSGKCSSIISCFPLNSCMDCSIVYSGLCSDATLPQTPSSPIPSKTAHLLPSVSWPLFILFHILIFILFIDLFLACLSHQLTSSLRAWTCFFLFNPVSPEPRTLMKHVEEMRFSSCPSKTANGYGVNLVLIPCPTHIPETSSLPTSSCLPGGLGPACPLPGSVLRAPFSDSKVCAQRAHCGHQAL